MAKRKKYLIGGQYMTVQDIVRQPWCNLSSQCIYARLYSGMDIVEAVTTPRYETWKRYEYKGKMRSLRYLARLPECRVSKKTLATRLRTLGWTTEMAVMLPPIPNRKKNSEAWLKKRAELLPIEKLLEIEKRKEKDRDNV